MTPEEALTTVVGYLTGGGEDKSFCNNSGHDKGHIYYAVMVLNRDEVYKALHDLGPVNPRSEECPRCEKVIDL